MELHGVDVGEDLTKWDGQIAVLEPGLADAEQGLIVAATGVNAVGHASIFRLAEKAVSHGLDGVGLEGLLFEFQFHCVACQGARFKASARVDRQILFWKSQHRKKSKLLENRYLASALFFERRILFFFYSFINSQRGALREPVFRISPPLRIRVSRLLIFVSFWRPSRASLSLLLRNLSMSARLA